MNGKGSTRRPRAVKKDEFDSNWDKTFNGVEKDKPTIQENSGEQNQDSVLLFLAGKTGRIAVIGGIC